MKDDDAAWQAFVSANLGLLNPVAVKAAYHCDAYFVDMDLEPIGVVSLTRYWFGLFSQRRGGLWKGMREVPLAVTIDDADALAVVTP